MTSSFIERVKVGKLLLMQEVNVQNRFVGKKLEEIDFMDIIKDQKVATESNGICEQNVEKNLDVDREDVVDEEGDTQHNVD